MLEPILAKAFIRRGSALLIKLGDKEIDFNPDFKLYLLTKLGGSAILASTRHNNASTCVQPHLHLAYVCGDLRPMLIAQILGRE